MVFIKQITNWIHVFILKCEPEHWTYLGSQKLKQIFLLGFQL